jgi:hypothetical protein
MSSPLYAIKLVTVGRRSTPIILQNRHEHNPLVAITNVFLLRGTKIGINPNSKLISAAQLLETIASYLMTACVSLIFEDFSFLGRKQYNGNIKHFTRIST